MASDGEPDEGFGGVTAAAAERMTFFSDAVVAIAITLLAIDLPVPRGEGSAQVWDSLVANSFEYLAFLISFVVIANHWMVHHRVFRWVRRADPPVVGLNLFWLLLVVITPFLTKVITEGDLGFLRFALYAGAQALQACTMALIITVLAGRGWFAPGTPRPLTDRGYLRSLVVASGFLVSLPLFPLVGAWAFAIWALVPNVVGRILRARGVIVPD